MILRRRSRQRCAFHRLPARPAHLEHGADREQIAANFQRELVGNESGLFACWPLDDGGQTFHEIVADKRYVWSVSGFTWLNSNDAGSTVPYRRRSEDNKVLQPCFGGDVTTGGDTGMIIPTDTTTYTLEAWICSTGVGAMIDSTENRILTQYVASDPGRLIFGLYQNRPWLLQGSFNHKVPSSIQVNNGEWTHLAVTHDGTDVSFYLNGELVDTCTAESAGVLSDTNLFIGNRLGTFSFDGNYSSFKGGLREVRVRTVARTAAEIKKNYDRKLTCDEKGLFGYWPIDSTTDLRTMTNKRIGATAGTMRALLLPLPAFPTLKDAPKGCVLIVR